MSLCGTCATRPCVCPIVSMSEDAKERARKFIGCLELNHDAWHHRQDEVEAVRSGQGVHAHLYDHDEEALATRDRFERHDEEDAGKVAEFVDIAVRDAVDKAEERFRRMIPILLTWKENMPTEVELVQAREDLRAAGITPEYLASLSIANTSAGGSV